MGSLNFSQIRDLITASNSWNDFDDALNDLGIDAKKEKGDAFEELTRLYLLTDPTFSTKIDQIWHHSDIPQKIVDELGLQRPEIGVDFVARVKDGSYWAIQCKFHQDRTKNVTYDELSTFFSITERNKTYPKLSHRLVCTSANGVSHRVDKAHPDKLGYLTSLEFTKLGPEEFDAFKKLLNGEKPTLTPFDPRKHQEVALDKVQDHFKGTKNTRGKIIHPCGSGKSLTGYWISQVLNSKTVLIAVPSLALVRQTLGAWTREAVANNVDMDWIAVCSDDDVKKSDDPSMSKVDLGIEVDTDPDVIATFLSKHSRGTKVLITTYQSGQAVSAAVKKSGIVFDLGIYDEAHKTVGNKDNGFAHLLYDENVKVKKRVFMTATERQFKGNSDEYLSMDDEDIYGTVIDELSFKAALEQKPPILSDYKIVSTIVTKSEIEQLINDNDFVRSDGKDWSVEGDASMFASLIALRKLVKERGIKHAVSFHTSIKRSKEFMNLNAEATKADSSFGKLSSFHVSGKYSTGARAAILERFVDAEPSLITNARCLTEGVDVPAIDAVLFADPKQSKIDIVQAAGRALRKFDGKDFGYIIIPVILDEEASSPSDKAFEQIINVISALGMNDERIIEEFKEIANGNRNSRERIVDFDVPEIVRVKFDDFISNVEIQIWDRLSFGWHKGFEHLLQYVAKNKTSYVPSSFKSEDGFNLGTWVSSRRMNYGNGMLSSEKILLLEELLNWTWNPLETSFAEKLKYLEQYAKLHGHTRVPATKVGEVNSTLGQWVSRQRDSYIKGNLSLEKIDKLEKLDGWTWNALESTFENGVFYLKQFLEKHGHSKVPNHTKTSDGYNLGSWVSTIRQNYRDGILSTERIQKLNTFHGWTWNPKDSNLEDVNHHLNLFVKQFGHLNVSQSFKTKCGFKLGSWVVVRRHSHKTGTLDQITIEMLENYEEWFWNPHENRFQQAVIHLRNFIEHFGHSRVPSKYTINDFNLGDWVINRRVDYKRGHFDQDRIDMFESLPDWTWDTLDEKFREGLSYLHIYVSQNGHSRVPHSSKIDDFPLGRWIGYRRDDYRRGTLTQERVDQLESLPMWTWNPIETHFQEGLVSLTNYAEQNGHTRIPLSFVCDKDFKLGQWIKSLRRSYPKGSLTRDKIDQMEAIPHWVWSTK